MAYLGLVIDGSFGLHDLRFNLGLCVVLWCFFTFTFVLCIHRERDRYLCIYIYILFIYIYIVLMYSACLTLRFIKFWFRVLGVI